MDVLEYWQPHLDWSQFEQGAVSGEVWHTFTDLVQLCHAHGHWERAARQVRLERPARPSHEESAYMRRKRKQEWERDIERCQGHMYRAAYLAAEKTASMSFLVIKDDKENRDWKLWLALWLALAYQPNHERTRCNAVAFTAFRADIELQGPPEEIAMNWLERGGYPDRAIMNPHPWG